MSAETEILGGPDGDDEARLAAEEDAAARREGARLAKALWVPAALALAVALGFSAGIPLVRGADGDLAAEAAAVAATLAAAADDERDEAGLFLVVCVPAPPDAAPAATPPIPTI
jgi:hypothetical protein